MQVIHASNYEILEWKGEEYYRFGPHNWMQLMGMSLEEVYDDTELENAYQALVNDHSSVEAPSRKYETNVR